MSHDQRVRVALDDWADTDAAYKAATRAVQRAQHALRLVLSDEAWGAYLALEERVNARHNAVVSATIRFASRKKKVPRPRKLRETTR